MTRVDIAIIGSGPAGLEAALTAKNRNKSIQIFGTKDLSNKMQVIDHPITNYLGLSNVTGKQMAEAFTNQMHDAGIEITECKVTTVYAMGDYFALQLNNNEMVEAESVILASGVVAGKPFKGESEFLGRGVSYCATCDGAFFRNKVTAVVGGGNVALEDAIFLSRMCEKVYLIHRRDEFRGAKILQDEVKKNDKIEILWNTIVTKIDGDEVVERLHIQDVDNHVDKLLDVDGIFIAVGTKPASELLSGKLSTDEKGYIIAGEDGITNIPGIFAAGDGRSKNLRQVVTAVSDGANCVYSVERYLPNA